MLKDSQTQRYAQTRTHRTYTRQFKIDLLTHVANTGQSIASAALQNGINANLLHRWRKEIKQGLLQIGSETSLAVAAKTTPHFIPIALPNTEASSAVDQIHGQSPTPGKDVRIECQCRGMSVMIYWPVSGASDCARMLRELLR